MSPKVGVSICCCNRLLRESIARILMKRADFEVMIAPPLESRLPPNFSAGTGVVVFDSLPLFAANRSAIGQQRPESTPARGVLVAMEEDRRQFLTAVRQGVAGYILQDASAMDVVSIIRSIAQGESFCPPRMAKYLFEYVSSQPTSLLNSKTGIESSLTRREQDVVPLLGRGMTNKEIAAQLNLSEETVKSHVHRILRKAGAENRRGAFEACRTDVLE